MTTTAGLRSRKRDNESIHTAAEPSDKDLPNVKNIQQSTAGSRFVIFLLCLFVRLCCAWLTRTYDNPDEYWQAQEVAHRMVFGYGYLTWEWTERIRSFAHPAVFAAIYRILAWIGAENTVIQLWAPKYFQAILAAVADVGTYTLGKRVLGDNIAPYILYVTLVSWYNFFMAARTLSNTMEMVLTTIALNYWPLLDTGNNANWLKNYRIALFWASLACVMRPTNALVWFYLGIDLIVKSSNRQRYSIVVNALLIVAAVLSANVALDTWMYTGSLEGLFKNPILTPVNFVRVNVINAISLLYGVHPWHWYFTQGIPVILTTFLPFVLFGIRGRDRFTANATSARRTLCNVTAWVLVVYSLLSHKEFRFVYPIVPILLVFAAAGLSQVPQQWKKWAILFITATQVPMALYLSLWHQRGVMDVTLWLRSESAESISSVGILMPCHSTPWQSVIRQPNISTWFLTCEPPLSQQDTRDYMDEADIFYDDPVDFMANQMRGWPDRLILFESLLDTHSKSNPSVSVSQVLEEKGYSECKRFFNSHFHDDTRRRGDVLVFCAAS